MSMPQEAASLGGLRDSGTGVPRWKPAPRMLHLDFDAFTAKCDLFGGGFSRKPDRK